uniref:Uncharacterized protein n=1 Tax=Oryza glumipatula TaxID=40148 RepID=A0A0E0AUK8_9ORYZ
MEGRSAVVAGIATFAPISRIKQRTGGAPSPCCIPTFPKSIFKSETFGHASPPGAAGVQCCPATPLWLEYYDFYLCNQIRQQTLVADCVWVAVPPPSPSDSTVPRGLALADRHTEVGKESYSYGAYGNGSSAASHVVSGEAVVISSISPCICEGEDGDCLRSGPSALILRCHCSQLSSLCCVFS